MPGPATRRKSMLADPVVWARPLWKSRDKEHPAYLRFPFTAPWVRFAAESDIYDAGVVG